MNKSLYRLIAGFRRFQEKYFKDDGHSVYQKLSAGGQSPKTLLIGCSDSRVDPAILTGAAPGEMFVVRNVANLVPPYEPSTVGFHGTSSALEFAVVNLQVENIIVLGHRQCGGIRALMTGPKDRKESFITNWMSIAHEARERVLKFAPKASIDEQCRLAEMESIQVSLQNLRTFQFIEDAVQARRLTLVGVYFDLERGQLWEYDEKVKAFRQMELERSPHTNS